MIDPFDPTRVLVRTSSHRAREKLDRLVGGPPPEYFSWQTGAHFSGIPADKLDEAVKITGVSSVSRYSGTLQRCWPR